MINCIKCNAYNTLHVKHNVNLELNIIIQAMRQTYQYMF